MKRLCLDHGRADGRGPRILLLSLLPIGDTLFTLPTVEALRARYPAAHLAALVHSQTAPLMRRVPAVDEVVVLPVGQDYDGAGRLLRTLRHLRSERFDVAVDFTSPAYKWVSLACGIGLRTYMKFDRLWWLIPAGHRWWRSTHATRHYYDCARELDLPPWRCVDQRPRLSLPAEARSAARAFLRGQYAAQEGRPLIGMHAGGAWLGGLKCWPPERFAALADRLHERWNARIVLLGDDAETPLATRIATAMRHRPLLATGSLPLLTSLGLIAACDLFVGNDSGLLHAAAALGIPYVGIFGPTNPSNFHPIGLHPQQGRLVVPPVACRSPVYFVGGSTVWQRPCCRGVCRALATLSPDAVSETADALLRHGRLLRASGE